MKKKILYTLLILCALCACNESIQPIEDETPTANVSGCEVTLHMGFEITTTPMQAPATRAKTAAEAVTRISASIFDDKGTAVYETTQTASGTSNFGTIRTKLQPGDYKVVIAGTKPSGASVFSPLINDVDDVTIYDSEVLPTYATVRDLTVSAENAQVFNVEVPPVVTILEMISTDEIPSNINSLKVTVSPDNSDVTDYALNPATGFVQNCGKTIVDVAKKYVKKDEKFFQKKLFIQTGETTKDIHVEMLDADDNVVRSRDFTDVPFNLGKTTVIRGAFFSGDITGSFTFGDWAANDNLVEF